MQENVDCRGSMGLKIQKQENKKIYRKSVNTYLYKYLLDYLYGLSERLKIPVIEYKFIDEGDKYYIESECYDDSIDFDEILLEPFYYSDIIDGIFMMKEYTSKYDNGPEVYNQYLKQIILSLLINDADRTIDNTKIYRKNNNLILAPYLDIHMVMNAYGDDSIFIDDFYFTKEKYEEVNKEMQSDDKLDYDTCMNAFYDEYRNCFDSAFNQFVFGDHRIEEVWQTLYNEINDKQIFSDISNLSLDDVIDQTKIQKNAYLMIATQFEISKEAVNQLLENNVNKKR